MDISSDCLPLGAHVPFREQYVYTLFRVTIKSEFNRTRQLVGEAMFYFETIKARGLASGIDVNCFRLCLDEMLDNAFRHGCRCESGRNIHIVMYPGSEGLTIAVKDEGCGFDPAKLENPLEDRNRFRRSGRGIHIMKNLGAVSWNKKGNCVIVRL